MRRLILPFAAVAPLGALLLWPWVGLLALTPLVLSHLLILYPTLNASSQWLGPVVTRFRAGSRRVWLTLDDGPHPVDTPRILDLLDRYGARATFFVIGRKVEMHSRLAREIVDRGHSLGNHSATHPSATFWCLGPRRIAAEIDRGNEAIERATGTRPSLFRAPVGMKNPFVHPALESRRLRLIGWSARGFDAVGKSPEAVARRILRRIEPGAIILAHEGRVSRDGTAVSYEMLKLLLPALAERGYSAVVPSETDLVRGASNTKR